MYVTHISVLFAYMLAYQLLVLPLSICLTTFAAKLQASTSKKMSNYAQDIAQDMLRICTRI
jgi:hypothetical protein